MFYLSYLELYYALFYILSTVNELQLLKIYIHICNIYIYIYIYISTLCVFIWKRQKTDIFLLKTSYISVCSKTFYSLFYTSIPKLYFNTNFIRIFLYTFIQNTFIYICTITQSKFATIICSKTIWGWKETHMYVPVPSIIGYEPMQETSKTTVHK